MRNVFNEVRGFVEGSVGRSVWGSIWDSVWGSVWDSVWGSVQGPLWNLVYWDVRRPIEDSLKGLFR